MDVYPAGERSIKNINSKKLVNDIKKKNKNTFYLNSKSNLSTTLKPYFADKNTIVFMGAGSITYMAHDFFKTNDK